jgi:HEAT repeat protein
LLDTTKISALTMLVIVAALVLDLAIKRDRGEQTGIGGSIPVRAQTAPPARRDPGPGVDTGPAPFERGEASTRVAARTAPDAAGAIRQAPENWALLIYPELARIAELENRPESIATASLLPMLSDTDPVVRLAALESLGAMGREAPLAALTAALDDPAPQIRIAALNALMLRGEAAAVGSIESRVFDRDPEVRVAAIDALAAIGDRSSAHTLGALLGDSEPLVRREAVGALGEIGGETALGYLRQLRYDPDESIRASAKAILREEALRAD